MGFSLDNYVDVATRLRLAFEKYPDLRIQETTRESQQPVGASPNVGNSYKDLSYW